MLNLEKILKVVNQLIHIVEEEELSEREAMVVIGMLVKDYNHVNLEALRKTIVNCIRENNG